MSESDSHIHEPNTEEDDNIPKAAVSSPSHSAKPKVEVLLKATGDAPIVKKKKWSLEPSKNVGFIIDFIKKLIKCSPQDSLFLYVNQSFAPAPDVEVGTLYDCFGSDGKLILHYCRTQAWG